MTARSPCAQDVLAIMIQVQSGIWLLNLATYTIAPLTLSLFFIGPPEMKPVWMHSQVVFVPNSSEFGSK